MLRELFKRIKPSKEPVWKKIRLRNLKSGDTVRVKNKISGVSREGVIAGRGSDYVWLKTDNRHLLVMRETNELEIFK